jgi:ABC-type polysaccharide/polyol phosphate export permease
VFYPIDALPEAFQVIAWFFPLTAVNSLVRALTLGLPFQIQSIAILLVWLVVLVTVAQRAMFRRLVR